MPRQYRSHVLQKLSQHCHCKCWLESKPIYQSLLITCTELQSSLREEIGGEGYVCPIPRGRHLLPPEKVGRWWEGQPQTNREHRRKCVETIWQHDLNIGHQYALNSYKYWTHFCPISTYVRSCLLWVNMAKMASIWAPGRYVQLTLPYTALDREHTKSRMRKPPSYYVWMS